MADNDAQPETEQPTLPPLPEKLGRTSPKYVKITTNVARYTDAAGKRKSPTRFIEDSNFNSPLDIEYMKVYDKESDYKQPLNYDIFNYDRVDTNDFSKAVYIRLVLYGKCFIATDWKKEPYDKKIKKIMEIKDALRKCWKEHGVTIPEIFDTHTNEHGVVLFIKGTGFNLQEKMKARHELPENQRTDEEIYTIFQDPGWRQSSLVGPIFSFGPEEEYGPIKCQTGIGLAPFRGRPN
jgi:hypothetical protein